MSLQDHLGWKYLIQFRFLDSRSSQCSLLILSILLLFQHTTSAHARHILLPRDNIPGAPRFLSGAFLSDGSLSLTWAPPQAGTFSGSIINTRIEFEPLAPPGNTWAYGKSILNSSEVVLSGSPSAYNHPSNNLYPFADYAVRVAIETTIDGMGPYSEKVEVAHSGGVPSGQPLNVQVKQPDQDPDTFPPIATQLVVVWNAPTGLWVVNTPIYGFELNVTSDAIDTSMIFQVLETFQTSDSSYRVFSFVLMDLFPNVQYSVQVRSLGMGGSSLPSELSSGKTRDSFPSIAPSNLKLQGADVTCLNISWTALADDDLGTNGKIIGYRIHHVVTADRKCGGITCPPPNDCQSLASCEFGRCIYSHLTNGSICDDSNPFTINDQCLGGQCVGEDRRGSHAANKMIMRTLSTVMNTRNYGAAYIPLLNEYWFPSWSTSTIFRHDGSGNSLASFSTTVTSIMQIWADPDSLHYYVARWIDRHCSKIGPFPATTIVWTYTPPGTANVGGITTDDEHAYCMMTNSPFVFVLDKTTGVLVRQMFLTGGPIGTLHGGIAAVKDKLYYGLGTSIYRYDIRTGLYDDVMFTSQQSLTNMFFTGRDLCISAGSTTTHCYKVLTRNKWLPYDESELIDDVGLIRTMTVNTRSIGGGYAPWLKEFWYPLWNGATVYRHLPGGVALPTFTSVNSAGSIRQIWGDTHQHYYVASGSNILKARFPRNTLIWSRGLPAAAGGVAVEGDNVYAMTTTGSTVHVLLASTGVIQRTINLNPLSSGDTFSTINGGLLVVQNKLYRGASTLRVFHRYDLATGEYDHVSFSTGVNINSLVFDGRDACVGDSSTVRCFQLLTRNVYDIPVNEKAQLIVGSRLLTTSMNQKLSQNLPGRYFSRCYSGLDHGFSSSQFHSRCDNRGPTVTLARVSNGPGIGRIIGGFTPIAWSSMSTFHRADQAFLFKFDNDRIFRTDDSLASPGNAIYDHANFCPTFGSGYDFTMPTSCQSGTTNPSSYRILSGGYNNLWLAGANSFTISEIEVFFMTDETYDPCHNIECPTTQCMITNECVLGRCQTEFRPEHFPCDDGNNMTAFDACIAGVCIGAELHTSNALYTLENLHPGQSYAIQVQAYTSVGGGPLSDEIIATTNETVPTGPPLEVTAVALSSSSVTLSWNGPEPEKRNGIILGYEVFIDNQPKPIKRGSFLQILVTSLQPYTQYNFFVRAYNNVGAGPLSPYTSIQTFQDVPDQPTQIQAESLNNGEMLHVTWEPPLHPNGVITKYTVYYQIVGGSWNSKSTSTALQTMKIGNLSPNSFYLVKISAWTIIGEGPTSQIITPQTGEGFPRSAPINVEGQPLSQTSIKVTFDPPLTNEGEIVSYTIYSKPEMIAKSCSDLSCAAKNQCHLPGECTVDLMLGPICTQPLRPDGTLCDDGLAITNFDLCIRGVCTGQIVPNHVVVPQLTFSTTWTTRNYGMGYAPRRQEWWFPQYVTSGSTIIYRYHEANMNQLVGTFRIPFSHVTQIWPDVDDTFFIGTYTLRFVYRIGPFPLNREWWRYDLGASVGGVSVDSQNVYVMRSTSQQLTVLSKEDGSVVQTVTLAASSRTFTTMFGTLAVILGKVYCGDSGMPSLFRYDLETGAYDGVTINLSNAPNKLSFDGENLCTGPASNVVECYSVLDNNLFGESRPLYQAPIPIITDSILLSEEENLALSAQVAPLADAEYRLCFRGSLHGFSASIFHTRCDFLGETLTVARTTQNSPISGRLFGGYSPHPWDSISSRYIAAEDAFLFRFINGELQRTDILNAPGNAIHNSPTACPGFGVTDLRLDSTCKSGTVGTNPTTYTRIEGDYASSWLIGGTSGWELEDIEVFYRYDNERARCVNVRCPTSIDGCQVPECVKGKCIYADAPNGVPCDDGDTRTYFDVCFAGVCQGRPGVILTAREFIFRDLDIYTEYAFSVLASTRIGAGPISEPVFARTLTGIPTGSPFDLLVRPHNSSSLIATWFPPYFHSRNGIIDSYTLQVMELDNQQNEKDGSLITIITGSEDLIFKIPNLKPFTFYSVQVAASTFVGTGPFSHGAVARTSESTPSVSPSGLTILSSSPNSILLSWSAVSVSDLNGFLVGYVVSIEQGPALDCSRKSIPGFHDIIIVQTPVTTVYTALVHDAQFYSYKFRVAARTVAGHGPFSLEVIHYPSSFSSSPICSPPSVSIHAISQTSVAVRTTPPNELEWNGNIISNITVYLTAIESSNGHMIEDSSTTELTFKSNEFTKAKVFPNLNPYTLYILNAMAISTTHSQSLVSASLLVRTEEDIPTRINSLQADATAFEMSVLWTAPVPANGILSYKIQVSPGNFDSFITDNHSITIPGLRSVSHWHCSQFGLVESNATKSNESVRCIQGVTYTVTVNAISIAGEGPATSVIARTTYSTLPAPTLALLAQTPSSLSLLATWTNSTMTSFHLQYKPVDMTVDFGNWTSFETSSSELQREVHLVALDAGTIYAIRIRSESLGGLGITSQFEFRTSVQAPPTPQGVMINVLNSTAIFVSWVAVFSWEETDSSLGYTMTIHREDGAQNSFQKHVDAQTTNITIADYLIPAKRYILDVVSYNQDGESEADSQHSFQMFPSLCKSFEYETVAPNGQNDRICQVCSSCSENEYVSSPCTTTTQTRCLQCNSCGFNQWQAAECTETSNAICLPCSGCAPGQYPTKKCSAASDVVCASIGNNGKVIPNPLDPASPFVCHTSCATCIGPRIDDCLTCEEEDTVWSNGRCVETCPLGTYNDGSTCAICSPGCRSCLNENQCLLCASGFYLYFEECLPQCPIGFYGEDIMNQCIPCNHGCDYCSRSECIQCEAGLILHSEVDACMQECPSGTYPQVDFRGIGRCRSCHPSCRECISPSPSACTACFGRISLSEGQCTGSSLPTVLPDNASSSSSSSQNTSALVYVGVAIGVLVAVVLSIIAISLLRKRKAHVISKHSIHQPRFEISNPTYMMAERVATIKSKAAISDDGEYLTTEENIRQSSGNESTEPYVTSDSSYMDVNPNFEESSMLPPMNAFEDE